MVIKMNALRVENQIELIEERLREIRNGVVETSIGEILKLVEMKHRLLSSER